MKIVRRDVIQACCDKHADSRAQFDAWIAETEEAQWRTPEEVKEKYGKARILPGNRVIFKIKGNHYRLVVKINYAAKVVAIRFAGTHKEYDRIDAGTV